MNNFLFIFMLTIASLSFQSFSADSQTTKDRLIVKGTGTYDGGEFGQKEAEFSFRFNFTMELWTLMGEPVVNCTVTWFPLNPDEYEYFDEKGMKFDIPVAELQSSPKVVDLDLYIPIRGANGLYSNSFSGYYYDYVVCDSGAMGEIGRPSINTPASPHWSKLIYNKSWYEFQSEKYAREVLSKIKKAPQVVITDKIALVKAARFNTSPLKAALKKRERELQEKKLKDEQSLENKDSSSGDEENLAPDNNDDSGESEGDFWSGEDQAIGTDSEDDSSSNGDDFWNGGKTVASKEAETDDLLSNNPTNQSTDEPSFWEGKTSNVDVSSSQTNDDFWAGGISNDPNDFSIESRDSKNGVVNKFGDILIPFKYWKILSYQDGFASVQTYRKGVSRGKCHKNSIQYWYYNVYVYEKSIVNRSGESISAPQRIVYGSVDFHRGVFLTVTRGDCDASCKARIARRKREEANASRRCERKMREEMESDINRYVNDGYKRRRH